MTWPARTWIVGELADAMLANAFWRDPLTDLRAGGIAMSGQVPNVAVFAASSVQLVRLVTSAGKIPRFNGVTNTWEMILPIEAHYPVGIVVRYDVATNPAVLLGFGTWEAFGSGRVTVAFDPNDPAFVNVETTGGVKTVTLSESELPSHSHLQNAHNHTQNAHGHTVSGIGNDIEAGGFPTIDEMDDTGTMTTNDTTATNKTATATNQSTGGGGAHNNVMPYIVEYRWVRRS